MIKPFSLPVSEWSSKKHHRWPALLTKTKKQNNSDVIYSFCGRLVPYWIMKVAREDFCLLRSIGRFHCHNTRRRSETGAWQMACHLRQHDVPCACVWKFALLHDFYNLRETECEKQSEICQCVCATHLSVCVRQKGVKEHEYMHTEKHVGGCLIHFHTPTQKAFGACCATAHFDSSTDLINLLLALFTKWIWAMLNC